MRLGGLPCAFASRRSAASGANKFVLLLAACVVVAAADTSCPDGDTSCMCEAEEHVFNSPSLSCSGSCPCTPWVGLDGSKIVSNPEGTVYNNSDSCTWTISGVNAQVTFGDFATEEGSDYVYVDECVDAECTSLGASLAVLHGRQAPGQLYQSSTSHLRVRFFSDGSGRSDGFTATVSGGPSGCTPCNTLSYKADANASKCTACPPNAVSAEGLSSCECPAGYTGDAEVGEACVGCEEGTFKPSDGPGECRLCPGNLKSVEGASSCICEVGRHPPHAAHSTLQWCDPYTAQLSI